MQTLRIVVLAALFALIGLLFYTSFFKPTASERMPLRTLRGRMHPPFTLPAPISFAHDRLNAGARLKAVVELPDFISRHPDATFNSLFIVERKSAHLKIPGTFADKVKKMFARYPGGTDDISFIENQNIVTTYNRFTDEYSLFNEIRRYRPGYMEKLPAEDEEKVELIMNETAGADKCDFCRMDRSAEDVFGRVVGDHCFTASNVAKYEQWHGLVIGKQHHPLIMDPAVIGDYIATSKRWFQKVHELDVEARFPHAMYDAGPRASASQIHSHMQISITHDRFYSKAEHARQAAIDYEEENVGRNYWQDVAHVHESLGLAIRNGRSMVISHLCPVKEREIIVVTESSDDPSFAETIAIALQALKDDVGTRAFSMAVLFEEIPLNTATEENKDDEVLVNSRTSRKFRRESSGKADRLARSYPALARIVDRGNPLDRRSDVGAMEFFGANNVGADPYHIMPFLRNRLLKKLG